MRRTYVVGLSVVLAGVLLGGAVMLAVVSSEARLGLALSDARTVKLQLDPSALHHGLLTWSGLYETVRPVLDTWHDYPRLAAMEPEEGARSTDQCLKLSQIEYFYGLGRQTTVRLCPMLAGTRIYLFERIFWLGPDARRE